MATRGIFQQRSNRGAEIYAPKNNINHAAFSDASSRALAWCGIMATEGCVSLGKGRANYSMSYACHVEDMGHIVKFKEFLQSTNKIRVYEQHTKIGDSVMASITFTSAEIAEFLIKNGITPRKSLTLCVSPLLANSPHFWRSAIDGDGSIVITVSGQAAVRLNSGSLAFIEQFCDFCEKTLSYHPGIRTRAAGTGGSFGKNPTYSAMLQSGYARDLVKVLYADPIDCLDRKKAVADRILAQIPGQRKLSAVPAVQAAISK